MTGVGHKTEEERRQLCCTCWKIVCSFLLIVCRHLSEKLWWWSAVVYIVTQPTTQQSQCYCHLIKVYGDHLNIDLPCKIWLVPIIEYCTNRGNPPITITKLFLDHHHFLSNCFPDGLLNWAIKFKRVPWSYNWSFEFKIKYHSTTRTFQNPSSNSVRGLILWWWRRPTYSLTFLNCGFWLGKVCRKPFLLFQF